MCQFDRCADSIWEQLLLLKAQPAAMDFTIAYERTTYTFKVRTSGDPQPRKAEARALVVISPSTFSLEVASAQKLPTELRQVLELYLPIILHPKFVPERVLFFGHLAQTLDAKIACLNGHSKWIGNDYNLKHAHRLRALSDAVMVGGQTVRADDCQLTVRKIKGTNPIRLVFTTSPDTIGADSSVLNQDAPTYFVQQVEELTRSSTFDDTITFAKHQDLEHALFDIGIQSVFIEGGAKTIDLFLDHMPFFYLNISPILLGNGIFSSSTAEPLTAISEGTKFTPNYVQLGDNMLVQCWRELHA